MLDAGNMPMQKALDFASIQHTLTTVSFTHPKTRHYPTPRQNAEHFAKKHGFAVADSVGVLAITMLGWATYVVGGMV